MNIAYSTTVQWNPGDELILKGVRNLINVDHNFIIYNRHPLHKTTVGDNSYVYPYGKNAIDHVIFAGTPDWSSKDQDDLYQTIHENNIDFSYIGVGGFVDEHGALFKMGQHEAHDAFISKAKSRIVRDEHALSAMENATLCPCPSLFAFEGDTPVKNKKKKICFNLQGPGPIASPNDSVLYKIGFLAKTFKDKYEASIVCHSFIDFVIASELKLNPFYSSDSNDYFDYYKQFDLVVGPRIHGAGWASTLAVPSITIPHDFRSSTAKHLGSEVIDVDKVEDFFLGINDKWIKEKSISLIELKKKWKKEYLELLDYLQ